MIPLFAQFLAQFKLVAQQQLDGLDQPAVRRCELRQLLLALEQSEDLLFGGGHGLLGRSGIGVRTLSDFVRGGER